MFKVGHFKQLFGKFLTQVLGVCYIVLCVNVSLVVSICVCFSLHTCGTIFLLQTFV